MVAHVKTFFTPMRIPRPRAVSHLTACVIASLMCCGCGAGKSPSSEVRATLERFAGAVAHRNYGVLCSEILSESLTAKLQRIGLPCEQAMARGLGSAHRPKLAILGVSVHGVKANATVRTSASNQASSEDVIELEKSAGRWRIVSLGSGSP